MNDAAACLITVVQYTLWCASEGLPIVSQGWCRSGDVFALSGGLGRELSAATAGSLTSGSSLKGAMVSSVM